LTLGRGHTRSADVKKTLNVLRFHVDEVTWGNEHQRLIHCFQGRGDTQEWVVIRIWPVRNDIQTKFSEGCLPAHHMDLLAPAKL